MSIRACSNLDKHHESELGGDETQQLRCSYGIRPPTIPNLTGPGVIFVFEKASLVPAVVGRTRTILNSDIHGGFLRKHDLNPANYRPDIIHEVLVRLVGSRLSLSGRIQQVYIRTDEGLLIKMQPGMLVPETVLRFGSMISQLFQKLSIRAKGTSSKVMQLIDNPLSKHLPVNSRIIGLSRMGKKVTSVRDYVRTVDMNQTLVFVVGAMAHGKFDDDYVDDLIAVSDLPLTAAKCVSKLCIALERRGNIL